MLRSSNSTRKDDLLLGQVELALIVGILVEFALDGFLVKDFTGDQDLADVVAEFRTVLLLSLALRDLGFGDEIDARLRDRHAIDDGGVLLLGVCSVARRQYGEMQVKQGASSSAGLTECIAVPLGDGS